MNTGLVGVKLEFALWRRIVYDPVVSDIYAEMAKQPPVYKYDVAGLCLLLCHRFYLPVCPLR